jgi:hypothetical protein
MDAAEAALAKLKSPQRGRGTNSRYLLANGGDPFQVAFGTIGMDNPERQKNARLLEISICPAAMLSVRHR